jgi:hypothetical protein
MKLIPDRPKKRRPKRAPKPLTPEEQAIIQEICEQ